MSSHVTGPVRLGRTTLPGGRLLGWAEWGPAHGTPVLFCPGAATTRSLGFGPAAVDALGVRLIAVDRPGLGASTPLPGRTFADFAGDLSRFAELRGLGRPAMVGNSQGAPFALACAAEGVCSALAVVSGSDEIAAPGFADALPAELRELVGRSVSDPAGAQAVFAGFDAEALWRLVIDGSGDADLAVYREPRFETAYRRAMAEAFAQGSDGYARDTVLAMGRWPFDPAEITVGVDLWYGEQDTGHSPDNGRTLTARIPGARRHLVPGIGGAVLWTHAEPILRTLLDRTR
ncbi:alpha/beta fold hydrolase [Amycolatopsis nigrescens]|uniref:alpha/beta fold hydrolase n=1 Tax=Amycolatopsis nigrescens TaxID=381445 RepID=UPI00036A28D2|nr:alpha/beta hydrolase [Amycolatopsis nigrescens]